MLVALRRKRKIRRSRRHESCRAWSCFVSLALSALHGDWRSSLFVREDTQCDAYKHGSMLGIKRYYIVVRVIKPMTADSLLRWEIFSPCRVAELAFFAYLLEPMLRKSGEAFNHNSKEEGLSIV